MLKKLMLLVCVSIVLAGAAFAQGDSNKATTAATTTSDSKPARFTPNKSQIMQGQKILISQKLWTGEATGVYGESRPAIKAYQKANGLDQTGRFDRATLDKMGIALTDKQKGITTAEPAKTSTTTTSSTTSGSTVKQVAAGSQDTAAKRPAPFRANKTQIMAAQKMLRDGKMLTGGEDGKLDDLTRDGLKKYQETNKIKAAGTLNAETLTKMGIALTDAQKANVAAQAAYDAGKKD